MNKPSLLVKLRKATLTSRQVQDLEASGIPIRALAAGVAAPIPVSLLPALDAVARLATPEEARNGLAEAIRLARRRVAGEPCA